MELTLDVQPLSPVLMDDIPTGARAALTDEDIARIRRLAGMVRALGRTDGSLYGIELWDASPRWLAYAEDDGPAPDCRMEVVTLHIAEHELYWTGCPKHSDHWWVETEPFLIRDLRMSAPDRTTTPAQVPV